ncbi:ATP-dependent DNA helicase Snf21, partial [Dipsacomyces acuminosporus]
MQVQATPEPALQTQAAAAVQHNGAAPGQHTVLTKDKLAQIVMAIKAMRAKGATEENSEEYAKLMKIMRYVSAQQQLQQQQSQQQLGATSDATTNGTDTNGTGTPTPLAISTPAPTQASADTQTPAMPAQKPDLSQQPAQFSADDISKLRKQIQAFRLMSKNMPLPPQLRQELWASNIPDEEKRLLDTPPAGLDSVAGGVVEAVHSELQQQQQQQQEQQQQQQQQSTSGSTASSTESVPGVGNVKVQLVLPPLPQSISFVSPHLLLKEKLDAVGEQGARLQRLLVPSITPSGLDVCGMAEERERRREARIEYRIKELSELPANIGDEQIDIASEQDGRYARPGLVSNVGSSAKLKALIELKALGLRHKQRALRAEVVRSITRASQLGVAGDRSALRRMKKQSQREARLTEKMERQQRQDRERREQDQHKQQLQVITTHGLGLVNWHKAHQQRLGKLGRSVLAFHTHAEREEQKRKERIARERIQALKAGDEEAYLKLVDKEKDTRISHLLSQTDQYLNTLIEAVHQQQQAMPHGQEQAAAGDNVPSWLADNAEMDAEDANAAQSKDYYSVAHRIIEPITQQPSILIGGTLKEYQLRGLEWMVSLYNNRLNGILADEMGLGKTIQTISLVTYLIEKKQQNGPFLIIVPLSTITNWILEFEKWAPSVKVIGYKGNPVQRRVLQQQIRRQEFQVLLTTYDYIIKDRPVLSKVKWIHMIIDEGHRMKNAHSKLAFTLTTYYSTRYRLILTGTPLQNNLPELWALLNFILPRIFSSAESFDEWFNAPFAGAGGQDKIELNEEEQLLVIKRLHKVLRPFLLRRLKKDVEVDLPDKIEHVIKCSMSAVQSRLYHQMRKFGTLFRGVESDKHGGSRSSQSSLNNTIMQLRKICNHPFVYDEVEGRINPSRTNNNLLYRTAGKFELLDRVLAKLLATNHKVLIFFQMTQVMTIMEDFLTWRGIRSLRLDGSTSDEVRREHMHVFNAPDSPFKVFLLSTRAGGQGLNLQTADTVVIFDSDWNPSADAQAMDRAHRIGQKNEVRILRLITHNSVEETILSRAEFKRDLDGKVIQAGKFDNKSTAEERESFLRSLLKADDNDADSDTEDLANSDEELNDMLARSDEERMVFARMDEERSARELKEWQDAGNSGSPPDRLFTDSELPEEYRHDYDPVEERRKKEEEATRDKSRHTKRVYYDDGLSEEQWLDALEDDDVDIDEVIAKKREKQDRLRKRREEKLLQQHLRSKLGDGEAGMDDSGQISEAASEPLPDGTPRKRGRPRRSVSGTSSAAETPGASSAMADDANGEDVSVMAGAESGVATPSNGRRTGRKRIRLAGAGADDSLSASATGASTPTGASRKARRKAGPADLLPPEERARLEAVFDAAFKAAEACLDPEYGRRRCDLFLDLPSKRDYPDYYMIIRQPIAMKTIRKRVKALHYASVADFHKDWKLMFDNARTYNEEGSFVYVDACEMQNALEDALEKMTGESYHTPIATQSPLPPAFSAALQQHQPQPQPQHQPAGGIAISESANPPPVLEQQPHQQHQPLNDPTHGLQIVNAPAAGLALGPAPNPASQPSDSVPAVPFTGSEQGQ